MKLKNILQIYCVLFSYDFLLQSRMKKVRDFFFHHNCRDGEIDSPKSAFAMEKFLLVNKTSFNGFSQRKKRNIKLKSVSLSKIQARGGCKEARLLWTKLCCFSYDFCFHPTGSQLEQKHLVLIKKSSRVVHAAKNNFLIFSSSLLMREDLQGVKLISSPFEIHVV